MNKLIGIVGLGFIGGSIASAIKSEALDYEILAYDINAESLNWALDNGIIDVACDSLVHCVQDVDIVIIATGIKPIASLVCDISPLVKDDCVITDVGSVKQSVIFQIEESLGALPRCYVPGHPIAGGESSGVQFSDGQRFIQRHVVLTPTEHTDPTAVDTIKQFWRSLKANIECIDAKEHDSLLALTSHMPHLLSYALLATVARAEKNNVFRYAGMGLKDSTRIALSPPTMWQGICVANKNEVVGALGQLIELLSAAKADLETNNADGLLSLMEEGYQSKQLFEQNFKAAS